MRRSLWIRGLVFLLLLVALVLRLSQARSDGLNTGLVVVICVAAIVLTVTLIPVFAVRMVARRNVALDHAMATRPGGFGRISAAPLPDHLDWDGPLIAASDGLWWQPGAKAAKHGLTPVRVPREQISALTFEANQSPPRYTRLTAFGGAGERPLFAAELHFGISFQRAIWDQWPELVASPVPPAWRHQ